MGNAVNCNFAHWRGSAHSFPRGEAVAQIGTSEPIWVTDEERRNVKYGVALRKNGRNGTLYPFFGVHSASHCIAVPHPPQCAHWGTFPPGEGILTAPGSIQPTAKQQFTPLPGKAGLIFHHYTHSYCINKEANRFLCNYLKKHFAFDKKNGIVILSKKRKGGSPNGI